MSSFMQAMKSGDRRRELEAMRDLLAEQILTTNSSRDVAALMRQLKDVTKELHALPDDSKPKSDFRKLKQRLAGET